MTNKTDEELFSELEAIRERQGKRFEEIAEPLRSAIIDEFEQAKEIHAELKRRRLLRQ